MKRGKAKLANEGVGIRLALVHQPGNTLTSDLTQDSLVLIGHRLQRTRAVRSECDQKCFKKNVDLETKEKRNVAGDGAAMLLL